MSDRNAASPSGAIAPNADNNRRVDRIDPRRAAAGYARWRRALAEARGGDPGARLDYPSYRLTLFRVFGSTRRLAELCLRHPTVVADALLNGPANVLADTARDLAPIAAAGGGATDALHAVLSPLKCRADIAIAIAELSGAWSARQATAARTDMAERLVETALAWLLRSGANRGDLPVAAADQVGALGGVFALAGGDFAHLDLAPYGPLDLVIAFDESVFAGAQSRMAERAFVRLGAELREAFEGRSGDLPLFQLRTPFGSGVNGAGFTEGAARLAGSVAAEAAGGRRAFIATARVVAGDREAGGKFLESLEDVVWSGASKFAPEPIASPDPRAPFRDCADFFRRAFGAGRPIFRAASAHEVFQAAAQSGALMQAQADRLSAAAEFVQTVVARAQMMKGGATSYVGSDAEEDDALAALCGFSSTPDFLAALAGAVAEARNMVKRLSSPPLAEFERYRPVAADLDDVDKLEDLGFHDGAGLSALVDGWASLVGAASAPQSPGPRFAALAPGLLTAFGETQKPELAVRLFDKIVRMPIMRDAAAGLAATPSAARDGLVAAAGCFSEAVAPLAESDEHVGEFLREKGAETPQNGREFLSRFAPPPRSARLEDVAEWRRLSIARVALFAASGAMTFAAAASALEAIGDASLQRAVSAAAAAHKSGFSDGLALYVFDGPGRGLPGAPTSFGFIRSQRTSAEDAEALAQSVLDALDTFGAGYFALAADISHRPSGQNGALAPDVGAFKTFVQSGAIAQEQLLFARAQVIAGAPAAQEAARGALRAAVTAPRRADVLLREVDRARAQRLRRDRAQSEWDFERLDGGPLDVDLIISLLIYKSAAALPAIQQTSPDDALDRLVRAGAVSPHAAETLKSARGFYARLQTAKALARWSDPQREPVRPRFAELMARAAGVSRFAEVRPLIVGHAEEISGLYAQIVLGRPTQAIAASVG